MNKPVIGALVGVAILGLLGGGVLAPAQEKVKDRPAAVVKWEYKVTAGDVDEQEMNKLGDDGWELAAAQGLVSGGTVKEGKGGGARTRTTLIFKRPKR
jgi:hypothetical protein